MDIALPFAMYKLVATDLDGTLLNSDHQLDPFTVATVRRLAQADIQAQHRQFSPGDRLRRPS